MISREEFSHFLPWDGEEGGKVNGFDWRHGGGMSSRRDEETRYGASP